MIISSGILLYVFPSEALKVCGNQGQNSLNVKGRSWATRPPLQLCSSATSTWTDPVWRPPTHPHPAWFCTRRMALGLSWLCLETSWWWLPSFISSSCTHQPIVSSPLWPVQTFWWEWLWCPSAWSGPWRAAGTLGELSALFTHALMQHFVTVLSSTCPSSPSTGTLLLLTLWSIPPSSRCLYHAYASASPGSYPLLTVAPCSTRVPMRMG